MQMMSRWALALAVVLIGLLAGCSSSNHGISGSGIVWVATQGDQMINTYNINESNGAASRVGGGVASGAQPAAMAMTPDEKLLFVANVDDTCGSNTFCNLVRAFSVQSDGSLKAQGSALQIGPSSSTPQGMQMNLAIDPTGTTLFVTNQGNSGVLGQSGTIPGTLSVLAISSSGLPATDNPFPTALPGDVTGNGPSAVAASPVGNFVYVANGFTNTLSAFAYDSAANTLTLLASYNTGTNPAALAFSRCAGGTGSNSSCTAADGNNLFVANSGASSNVSIFTACIQVTPACPSADGSLQAVSTSPVPAGTGPSSIIVHPQLDFVYVVDKGSNQISQFKYSPATGALTPLAPTTISTGTNPVSGGITKDGNYLLVPDSAGSDVAVFTVDSQTSTTGTAPTGRLARASTPSITLAAQPSAVVVR